MCGFEVIMSNLKQHTIRLPVAGVVWQVTKMGCVYVQADVLRPYLYMLHYQPCYLNFPNRLNLLSNFSERSYFAWHLSFFFPWFLFRFVFMIRSFQCYKPLEMLLYSALSIAYVSPFGYHHSIRLKLVHFRICVLSTAILFPTDDK